MSDSLPLIPDKIKLIRKPLFVFRSSNAFRIEEIQIGEIGVYFAHTDVYCFEARSGFCPYIDRAVALKNSQMFEMVYE